MKTVIQQLLELIPDAAQIKQYMSENYPDEKMLDEWLHEKIYKGKDWEKLEKEQIINSFDMGNDINTYSSGIDYYKEVFSA